MKNNKRQLMQALSRVGLVQLAMRRPITMLVLCVAIALGAVAALFNMQFDIFPDLGTPQIFVVEPYGGLSPSQVESFLTYNFESQFFYVNGIEHIESKSIAQTSIIKLQFYPGTNMASAMAEVVAYSSRALKNMPAGTLPPLILRFDSGSLPVGDLVFSSPSRKLGEIQDYALNYVRPLLATLPGILAPNPFGSSPRTIVINVDPKKMRRFNLSSEDVAVALAKSNQIVPAGNLNIGTQYPLVPMNSIVTNIDELLSVPLRVGTYPTVFMKDIGTVSDSTDIQVGYALLNGRRTIYLPVTKHSDASTLTVVNEVKNSIPLFKSVLPSDIDVKYEFDQSGYVKNSINSLAVEGILGALLTGLMVLLFLNDWRSALIVVINIPLAIMGAIISLKTAGQTINIMTLGGLALAIGILVDESTITIENIHVRLEKGESTANASINGTSEIFAPALLTMFCILAVFIPAFFMGGMAKALFVPLTLAVGFSIIWAFFLSMTIVPILATWLLKSGHKAHPPKKTGEPFIEKVKRVHGRFLQIIYNRRNLFLTLYAVLSLAIIFGVGTLIGREIFPRVESHELALRVRAQTGTGIDTTEQVVLKVIDLVKQTAGAENVETSLGYVGTQPTQYAINSIFLWSSGPQEAVLQMSFKNDMSLSTAELKEKLRPLFKQELPDVEISFEASGMVDKVMSEGSPKPIEIAVSGHDLDANRKVAEQVKTALEAMPGMRDVQYGQPFDYPSITVNVDREKAGIRGAQISDIGRSLIPVTSSSRFSLLNFWEDTKSGINYQVQVEVPQNMVKSVEEFKKVPISINGGSLPLDYFATVQPGTQVAEYDRYNMLRMATVTGNLSGLDLGHAASLIDDALKPIEASLPRGVKLRVRGQVATLTNMVGGLSAGLGFAVIVILLLLAGSFESFPIAFIVISNVPAVLAGALIALYCTGSTLNIESFMGTIMAVGVSVSNSILLVTFADLTRRSGKESWQAAIYGAQSRLRPVLMTAIAMIVGMLPMALGLSESGQQTAPLARAVIGGLMGSTLTTLLIMPVIYAVVHRDKPTHTASLDPLDAHSAYYQED
ncbi:MAG TPA: efflux RND transporter permease subunit [bacterium]|nr:efflux RND transporter permease subunit [bacterium]